MLKSDKPQVRQTQGVPRAVFEGLLRAAPGGLTFQAPPLSTAKAYPPLRDQVIDIPLVTGGLANAVTGPRDVRRARRDGAA